MSYRLQFIAAPALAFSGPTPLNYGVDPLQRGSTDLTTVFDSERLSRAGLGELGQFSGSEDGFGGRYSRFMDASIDYAYRSGNYFGRWNGFFTSSMLVSSIEITRKIRKAPWF